MVADPEVRVGLDVVAGEPAQPRPRVEEARPVGDDRGHRVVARARRRRHRGRQRVEHLGGLGVEDGLGRSRG